ncbi:MAG: hypothetical protein RIS07_679 [Actinomycetota bacterium]
MLNHERRNPSSITVVIPTYNEAGNIVPLIEQIIDAVEAEYELEVLVMDDSSPDGTADIARSRFVADPRVNVVTRTSDRGLGASVGDGVRRATGDSIVVLDADLTHKPAQISDLAHINQRFDLVSASRFAAGGSMQDRPHYVWSLVFNFWLRMILRTQVQDNLAGFYIVRRSLAQSLPHEKIFFGYGDYFFRLLHFAKKAGGTIVEIPTHYTLRVAGNSKSNYLKMAGTYSAAAIRLLFGEILRPGRRKSA